MKAKIAALALALTFLAGPGACDFFKSSGPEGGLAPFITGLNISIGSVGCDRNFVTSFQHSDPQDDIAFMRVTFLNEDGTSFQLEILWQTGGGFFGLEDLTEDEIEALEEISTGQLDLSVPGRASFTYAFECDAGLPRGTWTVSVQLVDEGDHESNVRSDTITLTSS